MQTRLCSVDHRVKKSCLPKRTSFAKKESDAVVLHRVAPPLLLDWSAGKGASSSWVQQLCAKELRKVQKEHTLDKTQGIGEENSWHSNWLEKQREVVLKEVFGAKKRFPNGSKDNSFREWKPKDLTAHKIIVYRPQEEKIIVGCVNICGVTERLVDSLEKSSGKESSEEQVSSDSCYFDDSNASQTFSVSLDPAWTKTFNSYFVRRGDHNSGVSQGRLDAKKSSGKPQSTGSTLRRRNEEEFWKKIAGHIHKISQKITMNSSSTSVCQVEIFVVDGSSDENVLQNSRSSGRRDNSPTGSAPSNKSWKSRSVDLATDFKCNVLRWGKFRQKPEFRSIDAAELKKLRRSSVAEDASSKEGNVRDELQRVLDVLGAARVVAVEL